MPGIATAEQARAAVAAGRFAPEGTRGACPCVRAGGHCITDWRSYVEAQQRETGVMALVETAEGLASIEAICAVEELLALVIGPFDLSVSMGFQGDYRHKDVQVAIDRMLAAARKAKLPVIAPIFNPDKDEALRQQKEWRAKGVSHFVVGTDKILFATAVGGYARALK
jgi:4-hydroxy-2-oxoheptanedioate aldolase